MARTIFYRTPKWRFDKDPVIAELRRVIRREEHLKNDDVRAISGVSASTVANWLDGDTRCPQNATITAVTSALGYGRRDYLNKDGTVDIQFEKLETRDYIREREKQATFILRHGTTKQKLEQKKVEERAKRREARNAKKAARKNGHATA